MTDDVAISRWFIATVWMASTNTDVETRTVVRLQAGSAEDYQDQVRRTWPKKVITVGPVSLSTRQDA